MKNTRNKVHSSCVVLNPRELARQLPVEAPKHSNSVNIKIINLDVYL